MDSTARIIAKLAKWQLRGVTFFIGDTGDLGMTLNADALKDRSEAKKFGDLHATEIKRWLHFSRGRNFDDAVRHLEFARQQQFRWLRGEYSRGPVVINAGRKAARTAPKGARKPDAGARDD